MQLNQPQAYNALGMRSPPNGGTYSEFVGVNQFPSIDAVT